MVGELAIVAVAFVTKHLAVTFSDLLKQIGSSPDEARNAMKTLEENKWVKVRTLGEGEAIYTITAEGFTELEKRTHKGLAVPVL